MREADLRTIAQAIYKELGENNRKALYQIELLIHHLGKKTVRDLVQKSKKLHEHGGVLTCEQDRQRSLGGIFFHLAKQHSVATLDKELVKAIFRSKRRNKPSTSSKLSTYQDETASDAAQDKPATELERLLTQKETLSSCTNEMKKKASPALKFTQQLLAQVENQIQKLNSHV
jgi:hypothetical protein